MNNREKKNIERTVNRWQSAMDLGFVTVQNYFNDEESIATAEIITNWEYREAAIVWNTPNLQGLTQKDLDEVAIHELGHIIVAPMSDYLPNKHRKLEEFVVQGITRAIINISYGKLR